MNQGIIPPHLLQAIARNGSPGDRDGALVTLSIDQTCRTSRLIADLASTAAPEDVLADRGSVQRTVYTCAGLESLPGKVLRNEGGNASRDLAVNEAYEGLGATWEFFHAVFGRN